MIMEWIAEKLSQKRDKEQQEVLRLKWELAEMQRRVCQLKREVPDQEQKSGVM